MRIRLARQHLHRDEATTAEFRVATSVMTDKSAHHTHTLQRVTSTSLFVSCISWHRCVVSDRWAVQNLAEGSSLDADCFLFHLLFSKFHLLRQQRRQQRFDKAAEPSPSTVFPPPLSRPRTTRSGEARETAIYSEARSRRRLGSYAATAAPVGGVDRKPSETTGAPGPISVGRKRCGVGL